MNLRDVANFIVTAGERRHEVAARRLSLSVAQLHASIRRLEHAVGTPLLAGDADAIRLTSAGAQFRFRAQHVLAELRESTLTARPSVRRARFPSLPARMYYGDVEIDLGARTVSAANRLVALTEKEFQLLATIALERGAICTRGILINDIWYRRGAEGQNTLNVHITTLRAKLGRPELILTVRGVGYRMATPPDLVEATRIPRRAEAPDTRWE